jgi:hypothetical protein
MLLMVRLLSSFFSCFNNTESLAKDDFEGLFTLSTFAAISRATLSRCERAKVADVNKPLLDCKKELALKSLFDYTGKYGQSIHVWDWTTRELKQSIDLGEDGKIPLELRFLHDPDANLGYVGAALSSTIFAYHPGKVNRWRCMVYFVTIP